MLEDGFSVGACADLGRFRPHLPDYGVDDFLDASGGTVDWLTLMEDRQPQFFLGYQGYDATAPAPLNRHGPHRDEWTHRDLKGLVAALQERGVRTLLGFWLHECHWVRERQRGLLMRRRDGALWEDAELLSSDFNPLKALAADGDHGIAEGTPFVEYQNRQYRRLQADFGFDGLFLGDGGMGFRRFGLDGKGASLLDFSDAHIRAFTASAQHIPHDGCLLDSEAASTPRRGQDVLDHHWEAWLEWNIQAWTGYYAETARAVHDAGGLLAAYNVMNYGPSLAYLHAADYKALSGAGLDILVFQTYDYAWDTWPKFGATHKDMMHNHLGLLATRAYLGDSDTKIVFTTETRDAVEGWSAPNAHTIGEIHAHAGARYHDGKRWRPAVDGTFVVWSNNVTPHEWRLLERAWRGALHKDAPQGRVVAWDDDWASALVHHDPEGTPADFYAHLGADDPHASLTDGVVRREHAERAGHPEPPAPAVRHHPAARHSAPARQRETPQDR